MIFRDQIIPKVSIISIALSASEFESLQKMLKSQTFQDYEFIGEAGGSIPEAWNRAINRARGEILVFTETDATPVNERWLEELVNSIPDEKTVIKGLEVTGSPWDLANLAAHRSVFEQVQFDERFKWAEDTELFCRLKEAGYRLQRVDKAPVIHLSKAGSKRYIRRAFLYGLYWARLKHRYADPVDLNNIGNAGKMMLAALLNLIGLLLGYVIYWPERKLRKR